MVAGRLIRRGMHPAGLWRSLNLPVALDVHSAPLRDAMRDKVIS